MHPTKTLFTAFIAGSSGGVAYHLNHPDTSFLNSAYSGGITGLVGAVIFSAKLAKFLNQEQSFSHAVTTAIATGFLFKLIFSWATVAATSHLKLQQQQAENTAITTEYINYIEETAGENNPKTRKAIALRELNQAARESENPEVAQRAIAAIDNTTKTASIELKLRQITEYQELYEHTPSEEIKTKIIDDLREFATGEYSDRVTEAAWRSLEKVADSK